MVDNNITFCANKNCKDMNCIRNCNGVKLDKYSNFAMFTECEKWDDAGAEYMIVHFETGIERPEILGSGSQRSNVVSTTDEDEAMRLFKTGGRNYLIKITDTKTKHIVEEWDDKLQKWRIYYAWLN